MRHDNWNAYALPLNDRLFREPIYILHAGWERVKPHQSYPRPGHPAYYANTWHDGRVLGEFCLSLITRGEGEIETKDGRQSVRAGQSFLYRPGEWHRHRPTSSVGWFNQWINFNGSLAHQWMEENAFLLDGNIVRLTSPRLYIQQFRRLVAAVNAAGSRNSRQYSWQAIGIICHFLADTSPHDVEGKPASGDPLVDEIMEYIWSHSHNQIGIADIARHTGVHRRTLERRFRAVSGETLLGEIQRCRLSRAELLLRETAAPIKNIIGRAGFTGYQQLRWTFHRHFGLSPEQYRLQFKPVATPVRRESAGPKSHQPVAKPSTFKA
jgi:AraC-like DNA-binding protein